jgi:hypothetical protein
MGTPAPVTMSQLFLFCRLGTPATCVLAGAGDVSVRMSGGMGMLMRSCFSYLLKLKSLYALLFLVCVVFHLSVPARARSPEHRRARTPHTVRVYIIIQSAQHSTHHK